MRVGLVGAGFVARLHAEAYQHVHGLDVEIVCVAAARPERATKFAAEFGVGRVEADLAAVVNAPDVDVVDLCAPSHRHADMAVAAARAGKHVIVEKPLTGFFGPAATPRGEMLQRALASADAVLGACREAKVRLCYAENWVYAPPVQKARRLLAAAGGPILRLVGEESHSGTHAPVNKRWDTGGGGSLLGKGCHPLGAALYLKADESFSRDFAAEGKGPFTYRRKGRPPVAMPYWEVPERLLDDPEELVTWARRAYAVALAAKAK